MQEYVATSQLHLSKPSCHESKSVLKPPPPKPYMQEYVSTSQLHLSKPSCHESKSFFKPPPPKPYMQEYASNSQTPLQEFLSRGAPVQRKKKHADSCGFIRD